MIFAFGSVNVARLSNDMTFSRPLPRLTDRVLEAQMVKSVLARHRALLRHV